MAVGHRLPNGYIVLLLTPREATLHRDQILAPEDYPWTNPTESQMVAMEVRSILERAVVQDSLMRLEEASVQLQQIAEAAKQKQGLWRCDECGYINEPDRADCASCGVEQPEKEVEGDGSVPEP